MGSAGVSYNDPDFYAMSMLGTLLGGWDAQNPRQSFAEAKLTACRHQLASLKKLQPFPVPFADTSFFSLYGILEHPSELKSTYKILSKRCETIPESLTEADLRFARNRTKADILSGPQDFLGQCEGLGRAGLLGWPGSGGPGAPSTTAKLARQGVIPVQLEAIDRVSLNDLRRVSRRIFLTCPMGLTALGNVSPNDLPVSASPKRGVLFFAIPFALYGHFSSAQFNKFWVQHSQDSLLFRMESQLKAVSSFSLSSNPIEVVMNETRALDVDPHLAIHPYTLSADSPTSQWVLANFPSVTSEGGSQPSLLYLHPSPAPDTPQVGVAFQLRGFSSLFVHPPGEGAVLLLTEDGRVLATCNASRWNDLLVPWQQMHNPLFHAFLSALEDPFSRPGGKTEVIEEESGTDPVTGTPYTGYVSWHSLGGFGFWMVLLLPRPHVYALFPIFGGALAGALVVGVVPLVILMRQLALRIARLVDKTKEILTQKLFDPDSATAPGSCNPSSRPPGPSPTSDRQKSTSPSSSPANDPADCAHSISSADAAPPPALEALGPPRPPPPQPPSPRVKPPCCWLAPAAHSWILELGQLSDALEQVKAHGEMLLRFQESLPFAMALVRRGVVRYVNPRFQTLLGYTARELAQEPLMVYPATFASPGWRSTTDLLPAPPPDPRQPCRRPATPDDRGGGDHPPASDSSHAAHPSVIPPRQQPGTPRPFRSLPELAGLRARLHKPPNNPLPPPSDSPAARLSPVGPPGAPASPRPVTTPAAEARPLLGFAATAAPWSPVTVPCSGGAGERYMLLYKFDVSPGEEILLFEDLTQVLLDQDARIKLTEQLNQAQRLEGLGMLVRSHTPAVRCMWAGGIAHDFNNLLSGIVGCAELLRDHIQQPSPSTPFISSPSPGGGWEASPLAAPALVPPGSSAPAALNPPAATLNHTPNSSSSSSLGPRAGPGPLELVDEIMQAALRAGESVSHLLTYSRRNKKPPALVDVNQIIRSVAGLLRRSMNPAIRLQTQLGAERRQVYGDAAMIQNGLLNLGVNARDAMTTPSSPCTPSDCTTTGGGDQRHGCTLLYQTCNVALAGPMELADPATGAALVAISRQATAAIRLDGPPPPDGGAIRVLGQAPIRGEYLLITVRDTGEGIKPDVMRRLFEPFFTTKPAGRGTGLGLPSVLGTFTSLGATIVLQSQVGVGTVFDLFVPLDQPPATSGPAGPSESPLSLHPPGSHSRCSSASATPPLTPSSDALPLGRPAAPIGPTTMPRPFAISLSATPRWAPGHLLAVVAEADDFHTLTIPETPPPMAADAEGTAAAALHQQQQLLPLQEQQEQQQQQQQQQQPPEHADVASSPHRPALTLAAPAASEGSSSRGGEAPSLASTTTSTPQWVYASSGTGTPGDSGPGWSYISPSGSSLDGTSPTSVAPPATHPKPARRGHRPHPVVLLVDDEAVVRKVGTGYLRRLGFESVEAANGREAVELFGPDPGRFAAVLLDLTMPEMSGQATFAELRRLRPAVPVLICSGFSDGEVEDLVAAGAHFLAKPYTMAQLKEHLTALLGPYSPAGSVLSLVDDAAHPGPTHPHSQGSSSASRHHHRHSPGTPPRDGGGGVEAARSSTDAPV
ncbi:putative PAS domain S-box protein [Paratrimastix pyriformis]|uniref:PAS domain S-box protein n=1 Tax=Paratrimastix pyriformis TaxID=342808 RepID=A0ABQ8UV55_9EUKA|nr:putative PAS domain S-box protein [Paratrimastix pyriformis]